jgi:hypothetical protein
MTAGAVAAEARSGSQLVLLTLAAGQFPMTLDSSVMNVSIATVAKDVGTTVTGIQGAITGLHPGDGGADDHRRQDRSDHRPDAGVRDRLRDPRLRVVHDRDRAEPARPAVRVVVSGGGRGGADPACDRR